MERHRVDHWLKLVCLFKHRVDATEACRGGHVKVNGVRAKPASPVREGDVIEFLHGEVFRRVVVSGLPETQASKEVARTMYVDETPPVEKVERSNVAFRDRGAGRPTKRDRREMEKFGGRKG
ncbi:MAG: RNA-binding S4 domain-containing protein [Thermoanaerobaculia bacterium]